MLASFLECLIGLDCTFLDSLVDDLDQPWRRSQRDHNHLPRLESDWTSLDAPHPTVSLRQFSICKYIQNPVARRIPSCPPVHSPPNSVAAAQPRRHPSRCTVECCAGSRSLSRRYVYVVPTLCGQFRPCLALSHQFRHSNYSIPDGCGEDL
jgi:hypothetical protein